VGRSLSEETARLDYKVMPTSLIITSYLLLCS